MYSISSRSAGLLARLHDSFTSMKLLLFIVIRDIRNEGHTCHVRVGEKQIFSLGLNAKIMKVRDFNTNFPKLYIKVK